MTPTTCDLCGETREARALNRLTELDICDNCEVGDLTHCRAHQGWKINVRRWKVGSEHSEGGSATLYKLTITVPNTSGIQASFGPEGLIEKGIKLFKRELQAGDPAFDKVVYVSTDTRETTARLIGASGAQAAIMELVGEGRTVRLDGRELVTTGDIVPNSPPLDRIIMKCCLLMRHVELVSADQHE